MNIRRLDSIILEVLEDVKYDLQEQSETKLSPEQETLEYERELEKRRKNMATASTNRNIDIFQTILDWAGFIPGYGDIIDAINAIIYFSRGKTIDGFLSLVAVVPVAGSAIKLALKGTMQSIGGAIAFNKILKQAKAGNVSGLADFYKFGLAMITLVNLSYCKKYLILLKGQKNPSHFHKQKDEE